MVANNKYSYKKWKSLGIIFMVDKERVLNTLH